MPEPRTRPRRALRAGFRTRSSRALRAGILGALVLLAPACSEAPSIDLAEEFSRAHVYVETAEIDVGTAPARVQLISGWDPGDEKWAGRDDETFVWGVGDASTLEFFVIRPAERPMVLRARPNAPDGEPVFSTLRPEVNGVPLPRIELVAGWQEIPFTVPARLLRIGGNQLTFRYEDLHPELEVASDRPRRLAVDRLLVDNTALTALPRRSVTSPEAISLPFVSGVEYELDLKPGAALDLGRLRPYGRPIDGDAVLHVRLDIDGEITTTDIVVPPQAFELPEPIEIPLGAPGRVRISILSLPPEAFFDLTGHAAEQDAGLRLLGARVLLPR